MSEVSSKNEIIQFMHCRECFKDWTAHKAPGQSMSTYARLEIGWTPAGLQVWCSRHNVNVMHVDFEGQKHPANLEREKMPKDHN